MNASPTCSMQHAGRGSLSLDCCDHTGVQAPCRVWETGKANSLLQLFHSNSKRPNTATFHERWTPRSALFPAQHMATRLAEKAGEWPVPAAVIKNASQSRASLEHADLSPHVSRDTLINRTHKCSQAGKDSLGTQHSAPRAWVVTVEELSAVASDSIGVDWPGCQVWQNAQKTQVSQY